MSAKSVAQKLLIKPNTSVWSSDARHVELIQPLPEGVHVVGRIADADTALVFASDAASLRALLDAHRDELSRPGTLWIAYPKGNRTDINRDSLWPILSTYGMRPITQIAVDDVWSALRFRPLKEGEAPFASGRT